MTDVLFGQSYFLKFDPKLWAAMQPYPPLGTMYAASYVRSLGVDVALFDAMLASSERDWLTALNATRPRVAVLYEDNFNYLTKMCLLRMRQAAYTMIEMARARNCLVVVAGSDATDNYAEYLGRGADYVIRGEGERTLGELLRSVNGHSDVPVDAIAGLAYRQDGATIVTPARPDIRDLDSLPFPAWDLIDVDRYRKLWRRQSGMYSMNVATSRGCPYHCNWCAKPIWGQRYNVRSPECVVSELAWLKSNYGPDHIWFVDDIMGLRPGWLERFADLVEGADARIPFKSLNRADLVLRGDTARTLRRAGARTVWLGAESGSQRILDAMEKGTAVNQIVEATKRLHAEGIDVGFFLQFGYPGESRDDIEATIQLVRDADPDDIGVSVSYPLPGTKFFRAVREQLGPRQNWIDSDDLAMLYRGPFPTAFYRKLHQVLHKEFRARKVLKLLRRSRRPGDRLGEGTARRLVGGLYNLVTLPLARWQLDRLARAPHQGLGPLTPSISPDAAAQPSPQSN